MDATSYLDVIAVEGDRLATAAAGNLAKPVPSCPGWTVTDLVVHLGGVYAWVIDILRSAGRPPTAGQDSVDPPTDPNELVAWFSDLHQKVLSGLASHDPGDPAWVFVSSATQNAGWWYRRQAHETAVHRYDTEAAAGATRPLEAGLAADGVDEYLGVFLPRVRRRRPVEGLTGTLHLHATDTPGEWWLDLDDQGAAPERRHAKADTAVRGPASGLCLWLWNRLTPDQAQLEVFGHPEVVRSFQDVKG